VFFDQLQAPDAVGPRHIDVHDDHIGLVFIHYFNSLVTIFIIPAYAVAFHPVQ